jgi:exodeoxyribonuclease VII large subunit
LSTPDSPISRRENRSGANTPEFTVSELSGAIKRALEEGFGYVRLRGEVSGFRGPHASGHCYFALKDDKAKIEAVVWKASYARMRFKPQEGLEVVAQGRITTFPGSSKYQIVIEQLEPAGAGALMALLEERKRKFAAEGLFEEARKKKLPFLPTVIGIVTSPTGAVIRDMLHGFNERFPARVIVWPVRVQGDGSAQEVAAAIRGFNALAKGGPIPRPDVLIVARGGGSLEDLWGFNEEIVVRAAADSHIPLISAVGHETDWTLIDLVADARAPTPTKAAEWAVPKYSELGEQVLGLTMRHRAGIRRCLDETRSRLRAEARGLPRLQDLVAFPRQRFDGAAQKLSACMRAYLQRRRTRWVEVGHRMPPPRALTRFARQRFDATGRTLERALITNTRVLSQRLVRVESKLRVSQIAARIADARKDLSALDRRAGRALSNRIQARRRHLDAEAKMLRTLSYQSVLARGYALVRDKEGHMVRLAAAVQPGDLLSIEFGDGRIAAQAGDAAGTAAKPQRARSGGKDKSPEEPGGDQGGKGGQGSLF